MIATCTDKWFKFIGTVKDGSELRALDSQSKTPLETPASLPKRLADPTVYTAELFNHQKNVRMTLTDLIKKWTLNGTMTPKTVSTDIEELVKWTTNQDLELKRFKLIYGMK